MRLRTIIALAAAVISVASACGRADQTRTYQLVGQVLAVKPEEKQILIKHQDIPGFMPAMTMPYAVQDAGLLTGRQPGDLITATLKVAETGSAYLSAIQKTGSAPIPEDAPTTIPAATNVTVLQAGDLVPDTALVDQDDKALRLSDLKGSAVALTFIYTRCPLPQFCPLMDKRFAEVQKLVAADPLIDGKVRLVSVSFDPQFDRAETLRMHARTLHADPEVWRFATADEATVDRFAATFGVNVIREKDGTITHNLRTAVIDPSGHLISLVDNNAWTADELTRTLQDAVVAKR